MSDEVFMETTQKPPIGLRPKDAWYKDVCMSRMQQISGAIERYTKAQMRIPQEWVDEYNDLYSQVAGITDPKIV